MKYEQIFTNKADFYKDYRPQYADGLFSLLKNKGILNEDTTVADIGCGTGIFSSQLIENGATVYGVEPNDSMLKTACKTLTSSKFVPVKGSAENTTLSPQCVDVITAAQAFHWFSPERFRNECIRILKHDGIVLLVCNRKKLCEMESERKRIVNSYFHVLDSYECSWQKREEGISKFFNGKFETAVFENYLINDFEQFIGRTLSASHALERDNENFEKYLSDWENYFKKYAKDGKITIPNETVAFWGKI